MQQKPAMWQLSWQDKTFSSDKTSKYDAASEIFEQIPREVNGPMTVMSIMPQLEQLPEEDYSDAADDGE